MNPQEIRANGGASAVSRASSRPIGGGVPAVLLVGAIAVLVIVVSMPRFRAHVLDANRVDAEQTIELLSLIHISEPTRPY